MFYVKFPRGSNRWTMVEARQVDSDDVFYQMPLPPQADSERGGLPGLDIEEELRKKDVQLYEYIHVHNLSLLFSQEKAFHDPCVKVAHTFDGESWHSHIFQGDAFVMGETGGTIDKL